MRHSMGHAGRLALHLLVLALAAGSIALDAGAQDVYTTEVRVEGGIWVPTQGMKNSLTTAPTVGVSARYIVWRGFSLTASAWFASPNDKIQGPPCPCGSLVQPNPERVAITQGDLGLEWGRRVTSFGEWTLVSSVGAGIGGRGYAPANSTEPHMTAVAGLATLGLSLVHERIALRVEARDYLSTWDGLTNYQPVTGNDLAVHAGIGWRW